MKKRSIKQFIRSLTHISKAREHYDIFTQEYPPGHFFSPIPSREEILQRADQIFQNNVKKIPGIKLNLTKQKQLLGLLKRYYQDMPFAKYQSDRLRYYFNNNFFSYADAVIYYCLLRHYKPKNIIEIGSGFSSAVTLDTNDLFFKGKIECAFIEPYCDRLRSLMNENDRKKYTILKQPVQDVPLSFFEKLSGRDVLFIDSSHVLKAGSDVNYILFEVLPRLKKGVLIHFHDIFYPFEYPRRWIEGGRAWNEAYALRAFLQYNSAYDILLFNTYLQQTQNEWFHKHMPLFLNKNNLDWSLIEECSSLWLMKN